MISEREYFDYLYKALTDNDMIKDSDLWRHNLEYAITYLDIDKRYVERIKEEYSAQFSEVLLINSKKNILLCKSINNPISKELCAISVYFTLLGCLLDFWIDSGVEDLRKRGIQKLSWDKCKKYFQDFDKNTNIEDIADELFIAVGNGMQLISISNPVLYAYIIELVKRLTTAEVMVANDSNIEEEMIYSKSVLFVEIALLIAIGNKKDIKERDYCELKKIGLLFAYIDDMIDVYEDISNNQGNIIVRRLRTGESYKKVIDTSIQKLHSLIDDIRKYFGHRLADFLVNEISDWIFTNKNLIKRKYKSEG